MAGLLAMCPQNRSRWFRAVNSTNRPPSEFADIHGRGIKAFYPYQPPIGASPVRTDNIDSNVFP